MEYTAAERPSKGTTNPRHVVSLKGREVVLPLNRMPSDRAPDEAGGDSFEWGPLDVDDDDMGDGQSAAWALAPLLANPAQTTDRAVLTTFGKGNTSVTGNRWHYIRYEDGSEELYERAADPHEWTNLAARPEHAAQKAELAKHLPKEPSASAKDDDSGKSSKKKKKSKASDQ